MMVAIGGLLVLSPILTVVFTQVDFRGRFLSSAAGCAAALSSGSFINGRDAESRGLNGRKRMIRISRVDGGCENPCR